MAEPRSSPRVPFALALGALGVVYGDIGTSPLYAIQTVFTLDRGRIHPTHEAVIGIISMVLWSILIVVAAKYVGVVMRADNDGEGGVLALAALVRHCLGRNTTKALVAVTLGILGACLFYGDSIITPAISVLSSIEGLEVPYHQLSHLVVPLGVLVLAGLFALQPWGTHRVGSLFGPVMALWFAVIALSGAVSVAHQPEILASLSPSFGIAFAVIHPGLAFVAMGAVVLSITGAEALYADMGHFGRRPISTAWFAMVFPALALNYLGQGSLLLRQPRAVSNPFFLMLPRWSELPMVVLATAATVIASQAVISGAYSMTRQAVQLGYLPPLRIRQTSEAEAGQIYLPAVNWALFAGVLVLLLGFRSSARLATAYGVAVTGTFVITTALLAVVARAKWRWPIWRVAAVVVVFGGLELVFFAGNLVKVVDGGWLPLAVAATLFLVMTTWEKGRERVTAARVQREGSLSDFVEHPNRSLGSAGQLGAQRRPARQRCDRVGGGSAPSSRRYRRAAGR
jgi:KUP system potassium uptake protein